MRNCVVSDIEILATRGGRECFRYTCKNCGNYNETPGKRQSVQRAFAGLHQETTDPMEMKMAKSREEVEMDNAFPIKSGVMFAKYKAVGIRYCTFGQPNEKQYTIFTDLTLKEGDYVVADTTNGPAIAVVSQVVGLTKFDRDTAKRLIISKVSMKKVAKKYEAMVQLQELRARLQERKDEIEEMAVLRLLAKTDPEVKKMMDDLFKLSGDITYQITEEKPEVKEKETDGDKV